MIFVRLSPALCEQCVESGEISTGYRRRELTESQTNRVGLSGLKVQNVMSGGLRSRAERIDRLLPFFDHVVVDTILDVPALIRPIEQTFGVGLVAGKEKLWRALALQKAHAKRGMARHDDFRS